MREIKERGPFFSGIQGTQRAQLPIDRDHGFEESVLDPGSSMTGVFPKHPVVRRTFAEELGAIEIEQPV